MVNKNDLRYVKTEALIRSTYLNCCREGKKNVTVTALCKIAQINKSTFYVHYENMEQLHRDVCRETIRELLKDREERNCLFTDPEAFVHSIGSLFRTQIPNLKYLFPTWKDTVDPIEEVLLEHYISPETPESRESTIRFCMGGTLRLLSHSPTRQSRERAIELVKKTLA